MYCPSCGIENAYGLRYCKRCGESLTQAQQPGGTLFGAGFRKLSAMFWAISVFGIVSLTGLFGLLVPLVRFGADRRTLTLVLLLGLSAIVGIASLLIHQLSRLITMAEYGERQSRPFMPPLDTNYTQIASPPRSVSGVTEHTTRSFDHSAYGEPGARD
jgi:hypothetical protein